MSRADVSFRDKEAHVTFDPAQVGVDQLIETVKRAGFRASPKLGPKLFRWLVPNLSASAATVVATGIEERT